MSVYETLATIQKTLKAPKSRVNNFGKYNYRSCEDILDAVKPLLGESTLYITDSIELVGDRYYVKAVATLRTGDDSVSVTAYAREEQDKKGMDSSQITGAASSYARKYALNGLFLIDDTKDADATNDHKDEKPKDKPSQATIKQPSSNPPEDLTAEREAFALKCVELAMSDAEVTQFKKFLFTKAPSKAELKDVVDNFSDKFDLWQESMKAA